QINGDEIRGKNRHRLHAGDVVQVGETTLRVEVPSSVVTETGVPDAANLVIPDAVAGVGGGKITASLDAQAESAPLISSTPNIRTENGPVAHSPSLETSRGEASRNDANRRLALLYELLLQCGTASRLDNLLQTIVERLVEVIPDATRGALLLRGRENDTLLLKAFRSAEGPVVSETLARRAMREGIGFVWKRGAEDLRGSIAHYSIESGMYAPLMWQGSALGVLCVDNPQSTVDFTPDDLRLLVTVSHYLSMALANHQLQEELRRESALKANLLRQFSPQIAEQLLTHGTLQLSGERSEVTILCSDIRGFTGLTKDMEPIDVVELLNDYFSRLIPIIFAHNGTVDKYIGDAILAVFGSPKKDPKQHENAVRAALDMQAEMTKSNAARAAKGKATCNIGIGVHCGEVLHGFVGAVDRMELTVIGDAVNRATRFGDGARGGEVIISPQLYQWVWKIAEVEATTVNTKHGEALSAFRLMDVKENEVAGETPQELELPV
ncbi:MAG TPA: adenylate/guanylate cyclase domain-containing protein, partial [Abditibacteriaceae bacterium]